VGLAYVNLIPEVRKFMLEEIDMAVGDGSIYVSSYLSEQGRNDWSKLLSGAAENGSDDSLADELRRNGRLNQTAQRKKPTGGYTTVRVPVTAAETMAEGEFNRFYVRGLCRYAITSGIPQLEVYRAKAVEVPRPGSEEKIGTFVDPATILEDLRKSPGVEPALGMPPGPNSGLTLKIP
jgi:hypothetical protein